MGCSSSKHVTVVTTSDPIPTTRPDKGESHLKGVESITLPGTTDQDEDQSLQHGFDPTSGYYMDKVESITIPGTIAQDEDQSLQLAFDPASGYDTSVTQAATVCINEDTGVVLEAEVSYAEFPTHVSLREANEKWAKKRAGKIPRNSDGTLKPFPSYMRKSEIFNLEKFRELDKYADMTPHQLMRQPLAAIVTYLNKRCSSTLEKVRAYFRWLCTRDVTALIAPDPAVDHTDAVLKTFISIANEVGKGSRLYSELYVEMCRLGGVQAHVIEGKVRTEPTLGESAEFDGYMNVWVAVAITNEWRLIDINFAARQKSGGGPGDWELIDDNGEGYREVVTAPPGLSYQFDENYFLTDPDTFIYNHRPMNNEWQLLARTVSMSEFQEMAFLYQQFFNKTLSIGNAPRQVLEASDGEVEININLPLGERRSFMYQLWRSTKEGKMGSFKGFELSQFVLLHQQGGKLHCRVVFPIAGDYKLDIYGKTVEDKAYPHTCSYIIRCPTPKVEWNALPRNKRSEWGYSHEMADLGLVAVSHKHAIIETDDGYVEIKFKWTKHPVDCLVSLRDQQSEENHLKYTLLRQNETDNVIIYARLPKRGLYALELYGHRWGEESSLPRISTYLIAATSVPDNVQPFPAVTDQKAGQQQANIQLGLKPKSHPVSVITLSDAADMAIVFGLSRVVSVSCNLYHCVETQKQKLNEYTFTKKTDDEVIFNLRFLHTGSYVFDIFAAPIDRKSNLYDGVFTYVIKVLKGNPEFLPFPEIFMAWREHGCEFDESGGGLTDGHVEAGESKVFKLTAPGAHMVIVQTEGETQTQLKKDDADTWFGEVNTGSPGKLAIYANYDSNSRNIKGLVKCEVKPAKQLKAEREKRIEKERSLMTAGQRRLEIEQRQQQELQQKFERIRAELNKAILSRDADQLRKAILKVEQNNYTKRLTDITSNRRCEKFIGKKVDFILSGIILLASNQALRNLTCLCQEYEHAKELKRSLDRVSRLHKQVLSMDQQLMAVIRSYNNPLPVIHATMRAVFLLLGTELKETKDWQRCKALSNTIELNKKIRAFDINTTNTERAKKAKNILDHIRYDDVQDTSPGAATFYSWSNGMIEEILYSNKK